MSAPYQEAAVLQSTIATTGPIKFPKELICKHCPSIVLKPNTGEFLADHKDSLPMSSTEHDRTEFVGWINVKDHFDFWNVGFSRNTRTNTEKYLVCADCERGPFGVQYLDSGKIYVAVDCLKQV